MSFHLNVHFRIVRLKRQFRRYLGWQGGILLGLILTGVSLSLFTPQLEGMMDMPVTARLKEPREASSIALMAGHILAQDDFRHADSTLWEKMMSGQIVSGDQAGAVSFVNGGDEGLVIHGTGGVTALLGPKVVNAEAVCVGSLSSYGGANVGMVLRRVDAQNWYKTYLDGNELVLQQSRTGVKKVLAHLAFKVNPDQLYVLRFRAIGQLLEAKAWAQGSSEPTDWQVTANVSPLAAAGKGAQGAQLAGYAGMSLQLQSGVTAKVTRFIEVGQV